MLFLLFFPITHHERGTAIPCSSKPLPGHNTVTSTLNTYQFVEHLPLRHHSPVRYHFALTFSPTFSLTTPQRTTTFTLYSHHCIVLHLLLCPYLSSTSPLTDSGEGTVPRCEAASMAGSRRQTASRCPAAPRASATACKFGPICPIDCATSKWSERRRGMENAKICGAHTGTRLYAFHSIVSTGQQEGSGA